MKRSQDKFLPNLAKFFYILVDKFRETIHPEIQISLSKELESMDMENNSLVGEVQFYVPNPDWLELIEGLLGSGLIPQENSNPRLILEFLISNNLIWIKSPKKECEFHRFYQRSTGKETAEYQVCPQLFINQIGSDIWYSEFSWRIHHQKGVGYYFTNIYTGTPFKEIQYSVHRFKKWEAIPLLEVFEDPEIQLTASWSWFPEISQAAFFLRSAVNPVPTNPDLQMVWGMKIHYLSYKD